MKLFKVNKIQPKWFISAALLFVAVLGGVLGQQQHTVPNQEIVVQFANENITLNEAKHTITIVEQELHRIGVSHIQISEQEDGKLVISYYSDTTVEAIKKLLSEQNELALGFDSSDNQENPLQFPSQKELIAYNLDVYEIHVGQNAFADVGGKHALELKTKPYRFVNHNFYIPSFNAYTVSCIHPLKTKLSFQRYTALTKDYRSHKIPEVRAGPLS
ncbi:hypothetical protein [Gelidibacter maritimus]|uniref:Uncharacterized protein n=1 Tax=Gelidibacter maritimus TaxID=2761487 RepID=A0A7W2M782_9FLAO|nr:hypothetical protein [Gelidibacter maritimus]MBA6153786.1 hypothetical protein [Gelidibacter maritimus]